MARIRQSITKINNKDTILIPFGFSYRPIKKLALINFEKDPDSKYIALEPQYLSGDHSGQGFRVIAYRKDGYVDVYDGLNLQDDNDDSFDVTGKGLKERKKVAMENSSFKKVDGCLNLTFQFKDKYERQISLKISEQTKKKTSGVNLLAPVGSTTDNPSYLPLFFLYDFDFIRKSKTDLELKIDGKAHKLDTFPYPFPKDFQWRYYTRYSQDCQIIEFANAGQKKLQEHELINNIVSINDNKFMFSADNNLNKMEHEDGEHHFSVEFNPGMSDIRSLEEKNRYNGSLKINSDPAMGSISGDYWLNRDGKKVEIEMNMSAGWSPVPDSYFTKLMFGKKSVFCNWFKNYYYNQRIDLTTLESLSVWENKNIK